MRLKYFIAVVKRIVVKPPETRIEKMSQKLITVAHKFHVIKIFLSFSFIMIFVFLFSLCCFWYVTKIWRVSNVFFEEFLSISWFEKGNYGLKDKKISWVMVGRDDRRVRSWIMKLVRQKIILEWQNTTEIVWIFHKFHPIRLLKN